MVTVREAVPADAPDIARVHDTALRRQGAAHYPDEQLDAMAPPDRDSAAVDGSILTDSERYVAVAEVDDALVGVGGIQLETGSLLGVFVHPDHTGAGVGTALYERLESRAREAGLETLTIRSALNAVAFYEACGFERSEETVAESVGGPLGAYESTEGGIDAVTLRKEL